MKKTLLLPIFFLAISFSAIAGNIVYPWRATTAIVKSGDNFEVWFNASSGQTVNSIELKGLYNTVSITMSTVTGNWVYDTLSGNTYNNKITVTVPAGIPSDRYDLVLNTSSGAVTSYGGVKVVTDYKTDYYIMHISDGHLYQSGYDTDVLLQRKSAMIDIANIIDAQIIIETGDNMYNVRNHPEREGYYFLGNSTINTKGMAQASAATFIVPGDHEGLNANDYTQGTVQENADFVNDYWGLQNHSFKYGKGRFMNLNNAWAVSETNSGVHQYEITDALAWLHSTGSGGNFFVSSAHCYNKMHSFIDADTKLSLVLAGDKHNIYTGNPYPFTTGSDTIAYVAASICNHFAFDLFKVNNTTGKFTTPSGTTGSADVLFGGNIDTPSTWIPNLKLTYSTVNDGTSTSNSATIINKFNFPFTGAKVRFVVPKGYNYSLTNGTKVQEFDGTLFHIVDATLDLGANSTTQVGITSTDVIDLCPDDPNKTVPGICGCGVPEGSCVINVAGVKVSPEIVKLNLNITKQLTAAIEPTTATNKTINWTSSDNSIVRVSSTGLITAVGGGTAIITASSQDGGKTGTSSITVIPNYLIYQAEDAELVGALVVNNQPGYNGDGFADFTNPSNDFIKWTVYAPTAGTYALSFRYALAAGSRPLKLTINAVDKIASIAFPVTGSFATWGVYTTSQPLNAGNNTITLTAIGSSGGNFDELTISDGPTGLNDLRSGAQGKSINIYPNPLKNGKLSIDMVGFENSAKVEFKIINTMGQTIYQKSYSNTSHIELNTSTILQKSVYIVSAESGQYKSTCKLLINN